MNTLPFSQQLYYAMGGLAMNLTNLVISQWLLKRYVPSPEEALLPASLVAVFLLLGRITDAFTDPLVGYWSDKLRSRWGRRRPFLLFGTLPFAVVFFLLWLPPAGLSPVANGIFLFVFVQLYFVLYTFVVTPYLALLPEITPTFEVRVNVSTFQAVFVMIGTILFGLMGMIKQQWGWAAFGGVVALVTLISFYPSGIFLRERKYPGEKEGPNSTQDKIKLKQWLLLTLQNIPFRYLVVSSSFYWFGLNLMLLLIPYWVSVFLGLQDDAVSLLMGPFLATNLIFFFVFNLAAKRWGKYTTYLGMALGSAMAVPLLSLVPLLPGWWSTTTWSAVAMGVAGIPVAGFLMLPFAILSDIVDYDESFSGMRREAIYFGVQAIFQKSMIGLSVLAFSLMVLADDKVVNVLGMRWVPVVAALSFAVAFVTFWAYPLREHKGMIVLRSQKTN